MSTRDTSWPDGTPCWADVMVDDLDSARLFYEGLFGWTVQTGEAEYGGYSVCLKRDHQLGAITPKMSPDQPSVWTTYLASSDVEAAAAKVVANGGRLIAEPMVIGDFGSMAVAADPTGAVFAIWQAGSNKGASIFNEPGSVIWNEQLSTDWQASKDFYQAVFGWTFNDMSSDGFQYATFRVDGRDVGGIGAIGTDDDQPSRWVVYFAVEDTDEAVNEAVRLGGNLRRPAADTPYGRLAVISDPEGAAFALMSVPSEGHDDATN